MYRSPELYITPARDVASITISLIDNTFTR